MWPDRESNPELWFLSRVIFNSVLVTKMTYCDIINLTKIVKGTDLSVFKTMFCHLFAYLYDSLLIVSNIVQSTSLSRSRRDPLKHFEISVLHHNRCAELRQIPIEQPNFTNEHVI